MSGTARRFWGRGAQRALFACFVVVAGMLEALYLVHLGHWASAPDRGFILNVSVGIHHVAQTRPLGEAAGLRAGDRIVDVNGRGYATVRELLSLLDLAEGHDNVYEIERDGERLRISVPVRAFGLEVVLAQCLPAFLLGLVFFGMGVIVFLMKPYEAQSWAFFALATMGCTGVTYMNSVYSYRPAALEEVFRLSLFGFGAAAVHLAWLFPRRRLDVRRQAAWLAAPWLVAAGLAALAISRGSWQDTGGWVRMLLFLFPMAGLLVFVGSCAEVAWRSRSNAQRLQALVMITGAVIAFVVPLTELTSTALFQMKFFPDVVYSQLPFVAAFPISIGYAIVRHDLFEIDVIVRRTYGYLLSTGVVILLYGSTVSTLNLLVGPSEIARSPFFTVAFVLAVVFLMQPLQGRIQAFVDRAFYRKQVDYRRTLAEVTDRMTQLLEPELVRETLVSSVVREMFLENGLLLAPEADDGRFEVVMAVGEAEAKSLRLDKGLQEALEDARVPVFRHEIELAPQYAKRRAGMLSSFDELGAELAMPMLYQGELRAVLSLGRKKSGRMFTREDVDLLRTLVAEGAVALENARLFDDLADSLKQVQLLESIKQGLSKFVPQTVQALIEESPDAAAIFEKRERDLSVMFADMTGYTRLSAQLPHDQVNTIVERYFGAFLEEILRQGGDVNETAGDGLMVLFQDEDPLRHAQAAVRAAVGMQRITKVINAERHGQIPIGVHIGINSGVASVGATKIQGGGGMRWTYTASGPTTNLAARIGALGEEIAITAETRRRIGEVFQVE